MKSKSSFQKGRGLFPQNSERKSHFYWSLHALCLSPAELSKYNTLNTSSFPQKYSKIILKEKYRNAEPQKQQEPALVPLRAHISCPSYPRCVWGQRPWHHITWSSLACRTLGPRQIHCFLQELYRTASSPSFGHELTELKQSLFYSVSVFVSLYFWTLYYLLLLIEQFLLIHYLKNPS